MRHREAKDILGAPTTHDLNDQLVFEAGQDECGGVGVRDLARHRHDVLKDLVLGRTLEEHRGDL